MVGPRIREAPVGRKNIKCSLHSAEQESESKILTVIFIKYAVGN